MVCSDIPVDEFLGDKDNLGFFIRRVGYFLDMLVLVLLLLLCSL